jgi:hypothetical protein
LIASHDPLVYEAGLVDRVIHLRDGKIEESAGGESFVSLLDLGEQVAQFPHGKVEGHA